MTTSNDTSSNKITKRDLKSVFFRSLTMEYSWNYERQQHMGLLLYASHHSSRV